MPSINEFYIDKEKRELINMIYSAKYISEEQKEVMMGALTEAFNVKQEIEVLKNDIRDYTQDEIQEKDPEKKARIKRLIANKKEKIKDFEDRLRNQAQKDRERS